MTLTGKAYNNFQEWFFRTWGSYPGNIPDLWMEDDQLKCYSLFFGCKIKDFNKLKEVNDNYNATH